jgi:hypothetical protein
MDLAARLLTVVTIGNETIGRLRLIRPHNNGCLLMTLVSVLSVPLDRMTTSSFQRSGVPDNR